MEKRVNNELKLAEAYYKMIATKKGYSESFWYAGYLVALRVALGLEKSRAVEDLKQYMPKEVLEILIAEVNNANTQP